MTPEDDSRNSRPTPNAGSYYDAFAASGLYDQDAETTGWLPKVDKLIARALQHKPPEEVRSVLDLGAGTGISLDAILRRAKPGRVVAVDASSKMLALLQRKHPSDVELVTDTIEKYVTACETTFDLITSMSVLEFVPDLPNTLARTSRLLNEGGVLAFTYVPHNEGEPREKLIDDTEKLGQSMMEYNWSPEEIEPSLTANGLVIVDRIDSMISHHYEEHEEIYNFIVASKPVV